MIIFFIFLGIEIFLVNYCESPEFVDYKIGSILLPRYSSYNYERCIDEDSTEKRIINGQNYSGNAVLLLGCSYTFGQYLQPSQTLGHKLSSKLKKTVYNFGIPGLGTCDILRVLHTDKNIKYIKKPVNIVIYTYMYDHYSRCPQDYATYEFLRKNDYLDETYTFFDKFYLIKNFKRKIFENRFKKHENYYPYLRKMILSLKNKTSKMFPNSIFILFIYEDYEKNLNMFHQDMNDDAKTIINNQDFWNCFKKEDIYVVRSSDFIGRTMNLPKERVKDDRCMTPHPSEYAWDELVPHLAKYINQIEK